MKTNRPVLSARSRRGQTVLAMVFIAGSVMIVAATAVALLMASFAQIGYGYRLGQRAAAAAGGGANDALLRLVRNKDFAAVEPYTVPLDGQTSVQVSVYQNLPAADRITVSSTARLAQYARSLIVVATVVSSTGQIFPTVWRFR